MDRLLADGSDTAAIVHEIPAGASCNVHVVVARNGVISTADIGRPIAQHSNPDATYDATYTIPATVQHNGDYDTLTWTATCELRDREQPQYVVWSRTLPSHVFGSGPSPTPTPIPTATPTSGHPSATPKMSAGG